ncbi:hypothetical protein [Streptosporangium amethystogenes]|nr:hypothetical protein [Streptosporangium amethystogenes]
MNELRRMGLAATAAADGLALIPGTANAPEQRRQRHGPLPQDGG